MIATHENVEVFGSAKRFTVRQLEEGNVFGAAAELTYRGRVITGTLEWLSGGNVCDGPCRFFPDDLENSPA